MRDLIIIVAASFVIGMIKGGLALRRQNRQEKKEIPDMTTEQQKEEIPEMTTEQQKEEIPEMTPEQKKEAEECIRMTRIEMEKHDVQELMLSDFQFQTQVIDQDRQDLSLLETRLQQQLRELLRHLSLPPLIQVHVYAEDPRGEKAAGHFDWNNNTINIFYQSHYDTDTLNAILCRECAHYFRHMHLIRHPVQLTEEKCTDVTACFMGCRSYMLKADPVCCLTPGQLRLVGDSLTAYRKENAGNTAGIT